MTEREAFEAAAYALYQSKRAAGTPMVDDLPEGTTPEGLFWKQEDGSYGVLMFNAAWWGWQQGWDQRSQETKLPERWVVVRETVLDVGLGNDVRTGGKPELGYALITRAGTFASEVEAIAAIQECALPVGWVVMPLTRLLPHLCERANAPL